MKTEWSVVDNLKSYCLARMILDAGEPDSQVQEKEREELLIASGLTRAKREDTVPGEEYKEAVRQILEQDGILEKRNGRWQVCEGMETQFKDAVYLAGFRAKEAEVASDTFKAAMGLVRKGTEAVIAVNAVGVLIKGAAGSLEIRKYIQSFLDAPKTFSDVSDAEWEAAKKWAPNIANIQPQDKNIADKALDAAKSSLSKAAAFASEMKYSAAPMIPDNSDPVIDALAKPSFADTMKNLTGYDKGSHAKILRAFEEVYKDLYPGELMPSKRNVSPMVSAATQRYSFQYGVSTINCLSAIYAEEMFVARKAKLYDRLANVRSGKGFLGKVTKVNPLVKGLVEKALTVMTNAVDIRFEKSALGKDAMTKAEMSILKFNTVHHAKEMSRLRGLHFAAVISELNLYRSGKGENVKTWFKAMRMSKEDSMWGIAYLKAGMKATIDGIRFDPKQAMAHISDIIARYNLDTENPNYDGLLRDFESSQRDIKAVINASRRDQGEPELQTVAHFDRRHDDMPLGESFKWVDLTEEEYKNSDLEKLRQLYDAVIVTDKNYVYYMGQDETRTAVGRRSDAGVMQMLDLTKDTEHFDELSKKYTLGACHEKSFEMEVDYKARQALSYTSNYENSRKRGAIRETFNKLMTSGFEPRVDQANNTAFTRSDGLSLVIMKDDPDPEREIHDFVVRTREGVWANAIENAGITTDMNKRAEDVTRIMESRRLPIRDPYADACREYAAISKKVRWLPEADILDARKYAAIREESTRRVDAVSGSLSLADSERFLDKLERIVETQRQDPILAACLCVSESFRRDDDGVIRGERDGLGFEVKGNTILCLNEDGIPDPYYTINVIGGEDGPQKDIWLSLQSSIKEAEFIVEEQNGPDREEEKEL